MLWSYEGWIGRSSSCEGTGDIALKNENPIHKRVTLVIQAQSREHLGRKLVRSISRTFIVPQKSSMEEKAEHIVGLARVRHRMKLVSHFYNYSALFYPCFTFLSLVQVEKPDQEGTKSKWRQFFTRRKRKAALLVSWLCLISISASQLLLYSWMCLLV